MIRRTTPLLLFFLLVTAVRGDEAETPVRTFAVRAPSELTAKLQTGSFHRFMVERRGTHRLAFGPEAAGEVVVEARLFPDSNDLHDRLQPLGVELADEAIVFAGSRYDARGQALALRLPEASPPTWIVVGHRPDVTANLVDQVLLLASGVRFYRRPSDFDYVIWENPWSMRRGHWRVTEAGVVPEDDRDDIAARQAAYRSLAEIRRPRLVLRLPPARARDAEMEALADALDATARELAPRIGAADEAPLEAIVEKDFVDLGRHLARLAEALVDDAGRLHLVYHPQDLDAYRYGLARALIRRAGLEFPPWFEDGAALWLSGQWYGRSYGDWLPDIVFARLVPSADELLAGERQGDGSDVLWPPVAAAVLDRLPGKTLRDKLDAAPKPEQIAAVLDDLARTRRGRRSAGPLAGSSSHRDETLPFQNGISFAMANGIESGYHAPGVDEQLRTLRSLGTDSVSLMPFAWQPDPTKPQLSYMSRGPSSETDAGMVHAARRARAHGVRVLWKPHIWVGRGQWPGDIAMTSHADWQTWWRTYRRYVVHHAVLAEWTGSELFSVGVELGKTLEREAEWRHLIRSVRHVYSGRLTYAGNWWGDYDRAPFWDELDYVGVDAYFPLSHRADADRGALDEGARRTVSELRAASERFGKPILLTEVGFAARRGAWVSPHEEGGELSEEDQERSYAALLGALGRPSWLAGIYVWKAFSHPSREGGDRPDFRFLGRGAAEVVSDYFSTGVQTTVPTAR